MDIVRKLSKTFGDQDFPEGERGSEVLEKYKDMALAYTHVENAVSVLSDMKTDASYIYYGGFARMLGLKRKEIPDRLDSIWEKEILDLIHPDDLHEKYLRELQFFHFVKHLPRARKRDYYLAEKLRMKDASGNYLTAMHRLFYIAPPEDTSLRLALCLYSAADFEIPSNAVIVNSISGQMTELQRHFGSSILSGREVQILRLIDKGLMSKDIAELLSISVNTVSRHRQEILSKLKVRNSIEACRVAKDLGLIA